MSKLSVRVYYEDTDSGGVVYYANYLKYIERGRSEYLRELNFDQGQLARDHSALFVVRSLQANYLLPAFLDDLIEVNTEIKSVSHASLTAAQKIVKEDPLLEKHFLMRERLLKEYAQYLDTVNIT